MADVINFPSSRVPEASTEGRKSLSKKLRFEVMKRDSFKCQYCGASAPDVLLQVDHIKPVSAGGTDDIWNLVTSCQPCNSGKSDRTLSDQAVVAKAKKQLDQLQERREQLEMLMEWQSGLASLEQETVDKVVQFCNQQIRGYSASASFEEDLSKLISRYGTANVLAAITKSAKLHLKFEPGTDTHTEESAGAYLKGIGAICVMDKLEQRNPNIRELFYIRGIIRKRLQGHYFDTREALRLIELADSLGVPHSELRHAAMTARNWSCWCSEVEELIAQYPAFRGAAHA